MRKPYPPPPPLHPPVFAHIWCSGGCHGNTQLSWQCCVSVCTGREGLLGVQLGMSDPAPPPPQPLFSFCYTADLHWQRSQPLSLNLFQPALPPLSQLGQWWRGVGGVWSDNASFNINQVNSHVFCFFFSALANCVLGSRFYYFFKLVALAPCRTFFARLALYFLC